MTVITATGARRTRGTSVVVIASSPEVSLDQAMNRDEQVMVVYISLIVGGHAVAISISEAAHALSKNVEMSGTPNCWSREALVFCLQKRAIESEKATPDPAPSSGQPATEMKLARDDAKRTCHRGLSLDRSEEFADSLATIAGTTYV